jgi:hypothetical protein
MATTQRRPNSMTRRQRTNAIPTLPSHGDLLLPAATDGSPVTFNSRWPAFPPARDRVCSIACATSVAPHMLLIYVFSPNCELPPSETSSSSHRLGVSAEGAPLQGRGPDGTPRSWRPRVHLQTTNSMCILGVQCMFAVFGYSYVVVVTPFRYAIAVSCLLSFAYHIECRGCAAERGTRPFLRAGDKTTRGPLAGAGSSGPLLTDPLRHGSAACTACTPGSCTR